MKNKVGIFPALLVLTFLHLSCSEFQKKSYRNLADSGRGQNDWLQFFLTNDEEIRNQVHDVLECHDLDTNETWGYFSVDDENIIFGLTDSPAEHTAGKKRESALPSSDAPQASACGKKSQGTESRISCCMTRSNPGSIFTDNSDSSAADCARGIG